MATPWNDDPSGCEKQLLSNIAALLREIAARSLQRNTPTVDLARNWHRRVYDQVPLPVHYYAGEVRDSDPTLPELHGYEVAIGLARGVPSAAVPTELQHFERRAQAAIANADSVIGLGDQPRDAMELGNVLSLCAHLHGEWVRIHPFANGNGRTARLWANWAALRYGLPPFVTTKPRPGQPYSTAAQDSMRGDHQPMTLAFHDMLRARTDRAETAP